MENLMNYSLGEIPPSDLLRIFLKHGITRIPREAVWELYEIIKPYLSLFQRAAVSALISGVYNPNLAELLKAVEKREGLRTFPKALMYDHRITSILRRYIDPEKWILFQQDVFLFGEEEFPAAVGSPSENSRPIYTMNTVTAVEAPSRGTSAAAAALNANLLSMAPTPLPANVLGPSRTGPRRTVRNRSADNRSTAIIPENSNENSNNNLPAGAATGPRRVYPELVPVPVVGVARKLPSLSIQASERLFPSGPLRSMRSFGHKNTPPPETLKMPKPKPTGVKGGIFSGKYRRTARKGLKRTVR